MDNQMATKIGTSFARRWVRLFLPVIVVTFAFMTSWHLFHIQSAALKAAAPTPTFLKEAIRWFEEFLDGSYVFHTLNSFGGNDYNQHMWSIAVEYRGSILIYVWMLAYFALGYSPVQRFWATLGLFLYFQYAVKGYYYAGFTMGLLICDLTIVSDLNPSQLPKFFRLQFFRKHTWFYYFLFLAGVYLGSVPHLRNVKELQDEPGWVLLSYLVPSASTDVTWYFVAVCEAGETKEQDIVAGCFSYLPQALLVTSIPHIQLIHRMFGSAPFLYLGEFR